MTAVLTPPDAAPESTPRVPDAYERPARSISDRAAQVRYRRAMSLLAMTLVLPGSAQLVAGNAKVGQWAVRIWLVLWAVVVVVIGAVTIRPKTGVFLATDPNALLVLMTLLAVGGLAWAALFFDAWRLARPLELMAPHRRATAVVNLVLAATVAGVLLSGAHLVSAQRGMIMTMFSGTDVAGATNGRYNVLLIGADSGVTRWGLRTDSMTLASIDARTGKTILIGLPRNMMNFHFQPGSRLAKAWPHGYNCSTCELNSLSTWADGHQDVFKDVKYPGVEATIEGVEGVTGLKVSYWAMINMPGFRNLVDAVGGVKINVRDRIAIGRTGDIKGWIQPGVQTLKGETLLWYARSRATSDDYSRMARQKCIMNAMLQQVSPATVLSHFSEIASASASLLQTDIPTSEIGKFATLALQAKSQKIATVSLVPPLINTSRPDQAVITKAIADAITPPAPKPHASSSATPSSGYVGMTEGSFGSLRQGYTANQTADLGASC